MSGTEPSTETVDEDSESKGIANKKWLPAQFCDSYSVSETFTKRENFPEYARGSPSYGFVRSFRNALSIHNECELFR